MNFIKLIVLIATAQVILTQPARSWPAQTTANVNLRQGPHTGHPVMTTIPQGTAIEVLQCDDSASWCAVTVKEQTGFMSGRYLKQTDSPIGWPRQYETGNKAIITLHQPQISSWDDYKEIKALLAAEIQLNSDSDPVFGVIELTAETFTDNDAQEIVASNIRVTNLNFANMNRQELTDVALRIGEAIPTEPLTLSLSRITAKLASFEQFTDVQGLAADPPIVFVSETDAILVQSDGPAVTAPVEGATDLVFVINSNWDIFKSTETNGWILRDGGDWLMSDALAGPWSPAATLPASLTTLPNDEYWKDARAAARSGVITNEHNRAVFYSDKPAELILTEGPPISEVVLKTALDWISNTESDLFFHVTEKQWYFLTSGRWFRSSSLSGPWSFATPDLPIDFQKIPDDSRYYTVRSSVPGTPESDEARLIAAIPQMARVETGSLSVDVVYSGEPVFEPIEGTSMFYTVNASEIVIQIAAQYYVVKDGVWFVSATPEGLFEVATTVPEVAYTIPPSSPVHNVTYVRIYDQSPGAVWFGFTMGYLFGYLAWDTFVYGSGWYYPPYWHHNPGHFPIYHPRPVSYGFGGYYDPARGAFGRYGYAYGPYRGIGGGSVYNPTTGKYVRGAIATGPSGSRGLISAYNPRTNTRAVARGGSNVYGSWASGGVKQGTDWARASAVKGNSGGGAVRWNTSGGKSGTIVRGPKGEIYAGRDGNVYRQKDGKWQRNEDGKWSEAAAPKIQKRKSQTKVRKNPDQQTSGLRNRTVPTSVGYARVDRQTGYQRANQKRQVQQYRPQQTRARTQVQRTRPQAQSRTPRSIPRNIPSRRRR